MILSRSGVTREQSALIDEVNLHDRLGSGTSIQLGPSTSCHHSTHLPDLMILLLEQKPFCSLPLHSTREYSMMNKYGFVRYLMA